MIKYTRPNYPKDWYAISNICLVDEDEGSALECIFVRCGFKSNYETMHCASPDFSPMIGPLFLTFDWLMKMKGRY